MSLKTNFFFRDKFTKQKDFYLRIFTEIISKLLNFSVIPLITYNLGASEYGNYVQVLCIISGLAPLICLGLNFTIIKKLAGVKKMEKNTEGFLICFILMSFSTLVILIISNIPILTTNIELPATANIIIFLAYLFALEVLITELLRSKMKTNQFCFLQCLNSFLLLIFIMIACYYMSFNLSIILNILFFVKSIIFVIGIYFLFKSKIISLKITKFSNTIIKKFLMPGLIFMLTGLAEWSLNFSDKIILGKYLSAELCAIYFSVYLISTGVLSLGSIFWWRLFPEISNYNNKQKNTKIFNEIASSNIKYINLVIPFILLITFIGPLLLSYLLNLKFDNLGIIIFFYSSGLFFHQISTGWEFFCYLKNKGKYVFINTIFWGFVSLILYIIFIPKFSIFGAVIVFLSMRILSSASLKLFSKKIGYNSNLVNSKLIQNEILNIFIVLITYVCLKNLLFTDESIFNSIAITVICLFFYFLLKNFIYLLKRSN